MVLDSALVCASLAATAAPGLTAPSASLTTPASRPLPSCASPDDATARQAASAKTTNLVGIHMCISWRLVRGAAAGATRFVGVRNEANAPGVTSVSIYE